MGKLTTHVLDTNLGRPAVGLHIELWRDGAKIKSVTTNADGRVDEPLLQGEAMKVGIHELQFHAGAYLKATGVALSDPPFLDVIPIRFALSNPDQHYHVPLLLSAHGYSTYRGS